MLTCTATLSRVPGSRPQSAGQPSLSSCRGPDRRLNAVECVLRGLISVDRPGGASLVVGSCVFEAGASCRFLGSGDRQEVSRKWRSSKSRAGARRRGWRRRCCVPRPINFRSAVARGPEWSPMAHRSPWRVARPHPSHAEPLNQSIPSLHARVRNARSRSFIQAPMR